MSAFTSELITRVKEHFPDNADGLHEALLKPNPSYALSLLCERVNTAIPAEDIVVLLEAGKAEDLLNMARFEVAGMALLDEAFKQARQVPRPWKQFG